MKHVYGAMCHCPAKRNTETWATKTAPLTLQYPRLYSKLGNIVIQGSSTALYYHSRIFMIRSGLFVIVLATFTIGLNIEEQKEITTEHPCI